MQDRAGLKTAEIVFECQPVKGMCGGLRDCQSVIFDSFANLSTHNTCSNNLLTFSSFNHFYFHPYLIHVLDIKCDPLCGIVACV